jgi:phosphohistidine phosphatase
MKTLIIVRHAKSSWEEAGQKDIERPLNDRGKKDAPEMAKRLYKKIKNIDLFISSPAVRAYRTAREFAEKYGVSKKDILKEKELYHSADTKTFFKVISTVKDKKETIALFSHNPGITDFANALTAMQIDNLPTCGVFVVSAETVTWKDFERAPKTFLFFDYPKNKAS